MRFLLLLLLLPISNLLFAQNNLYFPPLNGQNWETVSPDSLAWCQDRIDSLLDFLEVKNSRSFMVLHKGKIAIEAYFDGTDQNSVWYWASAGKSLMAFLTGMAQEESLLDIQDSTSHYLGTGWTNTTPEQEGQITLHHQLTMSTGLDDGVPDPDCLDDTCLLYLAPPFTRWAYHNAPYRLLQDVLENASGIPLNQYTNTRLGDRIGMEGFWLNYVRWGKARDMARFGLLMLGEGIWDGDTLLHDQAYYQAMISPSQNENLAYGYLWWLNGQGSHMLPTLQIKFPTDLVPNAPADMYAALGKNDQKIYVVPSMDLVVVRQGESAGNSAFAASSFDNELWDKLNQVFCASATPVDAPIQLDISLYPNPARDQLHLQFQSPIGGPLNVRIHNLMGTLLYAGAWEHFAGTGIDISVRHLPRGIYSVQVEAGAIKWQQKWIKE
jgi:CubicO group peptidase (beta-lactamase class C family)